MRHMIACSFIEGPAMSWARAASIMPAIWYPASTVSDQRFQALRVDYLRVFS